VQVPVVPLEEQADLCRNFKELQDMETEVERIQQRMADIRDQLFNSTGVHG